MAVGGVDMKLIDDILRKKDVFISESKGKKIKLITPFFFYILRLLILLAIGYIIMYPLLQMIVTSIKDKMAFFDAARVWLPSGFNIKFNYSMAIDALDYFNSIKSTLVLQILSAAIEVITCAVTAYGFARFKFPYKNFWMTGLFITILIPETMIIITRVVNYSHMDFLGVLGLFYKISGIDLRPNIIGTPLAFWLPSVFAIGLRSGILIYIYIQFFKNLPYELEEAAWVDGANPIKTFISIALPSSGVVITTVAVFSFVWHWNDSFLSSMYMRGEYPLAVNLERVNTTLFSMGYFNDQNVEAQAILMASCVLFVIPPLIIYMILQRHFIESIDRVGITG